MRQNYTVREIYQGDGATTNFTFSFKITDKAHLKVLKIDDEGEIVWNVRATDDTYFNTTLRKDDGTLVLATVLEDNYKLIILLAPDEPVQGYNYAADARYTGLKLENTFDSVIGYLQRMRYLIDRAIVMPDNYVADFDPTLPEPVGSGVLIVNELNTGFEFVPLATIKSILQRLDTAEADIDNLEVRMTAVENMNDDQNERLDLIEAKNVQQDGRLDVLEDHDADHETRITNLETVFGTVQTAEASAAAAAQSAADAANSAASAAGSATQAGISAGDALAVYQDLAALLASLPPGAITTVLGGGGGTTGVMRHDYIDKSVDLDGGSEIEYDGLKEYISDDSPIIPFINGLLHATVDGLSMMKVNRKNFTKQNVIIDPDNQPDETQELMVAYCYSTCGLRFVIDFFGFGDGATNNFTLSETPKNGAMVKGYRNGGKVHQSKVQFAAGDLTFLDGPPEEDQLVFAIYQIDVPSMFDHRVEDLAGVRDGNNRSFGPVLFRPADKLSAFCHFNGWVLPPGAFKLEGQMVVFEEGFQPEADQIPELDYCYAL